MNKKILKQAENRYQMNVDRLQKKALKAVHNNANAGLKPDDIEGEQPEKEGGNGI